MNELLQKYIRTELGLQMSLMHGHVEQIKVLLSETFDFSTFDCSLSVQVPVDL